MSTDEWNILLVLLWLWNIRFQVEYISLLSRGSEQSSLYAVKVQAVLSKTGLSRSIDDSGMSEFLLQSDIGKKRERIDGEIFIIYLETRFFISRTYLN